MAKTFENAAIKFKDKDGNSGVLYGMSESDIQKVKDTMLLAKDNKEAIEKLKKMFPDLEGEDIQEIDLTGLAHLDEAQTFTEANTFSKDITMSVVQNDIASIADQSVVTGKPLKALNEKLEDTLEKLETALPGFEEGTLEPVDLEGVAYVNKSQTFTEANTFSKDITMSVVQEDIDAIADQSVVTGKPLKALKDMISAGAIEFVDAEPDVGDMDPNKFYAFPSPDRLTE